MEPTLMVIGLNHRTAPLAMRERFWIGKNRRYEVLQQLKSAEGIEEVVVLSTCCRTEFLLWASEPTLAANSLLQFLGTQHGLKLSEWEHFYRLLDECALTQVFRVTSGLDSLVLGEPQIVSQVKAAWEPARTVGAAGRFLNAVLEKALNVSTRVRSETEVGKLAVTIPTAALELAQQIFGSLEGRKVLLLGTGKMSALSARQMVDSGASSVVVIDQSAARAQEIAQTLGGTAATLADRWKCMLRADIVISASGCPHVILTREEAERIANERNRVALVIIDIGMPRDVDPEVRRVDGIVLCDMDGLERVVKSNTADRTAAVAGAERIVAAEAQSFRGTLQAEVAVPTIVALRRRLDEICRQELESFIEEHGPYTREQVQSLHAITGQVIQKIASSLARELKELPEKGEQEQMTAVVTRLFHLDSLKADSPQQALAGTRSETANEQRKQHAVAINY
ncbi:MAG TPA: glutamyl-tRNA reductase [Candidatus Sulfotelmatobacter sp.]|nr:glutamyl-tRNA reductase [Candidatus Sulfotelmatobacter sp.]